MPEISLQGPHITLANAVKVAGLADTGGQAKVRVRSGDIRVNGVVEMQPGRKLRAGDVFRAERDTEDWTIIDPSATAPTRDPA